MSKQLARGTKVIMYNKQYIIDSCVGTNEYVCSAVGHNGNKVAAHVRDLIVQTIAPKGTTFKVEETEEDIPETSVVETFDSSLSEDTVEALASLQNAIDENNNVEVNGEDGLD
jgi:hypothetical protein